MLRFLERLGRRKLGQWAVAYVAAAWVVMQFVDVLADRWPVPLGAQRAVDVLLVVGFFITLVLAWYHGERGRQRVSGLELLIVAGLLAAGGVGLALVTPNRSELPGARPDDARPSVAVLPFDSWSTLEEDAFFTDGVHDQILTQLTKVSSLRVISRTSVMEYRGRTANSRDIGTELGAAYLMEGSVQRAGERVLVTVQLIDAGTDGHVWSDSYEYGLSVDSVFAVQRAVAGNVAAALSVHLLPDEAERIELRPTADLGAYEAYVRGTLMSTQGGYERWQRTVELFEEAIDRDPQFGLAWAALTRTLATGFANAYVTDAEYPRRALAEALRLAPAAEETRYALAGVRYWIDRDYPAALEALDEALALRPSDAAALELKGAILRRMDRWTETTAALEEVVRLDPRSTLAHSFLGTAYLRAGDLEAAGRMADRLAALGGGTELRIGIELARGDTAEAWATASQADPPVRFLWDEGVTVAFLRRDFDTAFRQHFDEDPERLPPLLRSGRLGWLAETARLAGRSDVQAVYADSLTTLAHEILETFQAQDLGGYRFPLSLAHIHVSRANGLAGNDSAAVAHARQAMAVYAPSSDVQDARRVQYFQVLALGNAGAVEEAVGILGDLLESGQPLGPRLPIHPLYDPMRSHPRFQELEARYGVPRTP